MIQEQLFEETTNSALFKNKSNHEPEEIDRLLLNEITEESNLMGENRDFMPNKVHRFEQSGENCEKYNSNCFKREREYSDIEFDRARADLRNVLYSIDF